MVRWGTGRGKAKSYRRQKVPICVYDKYPYFSPIDPGRSWLVCSFPAVPRGFAGAKWISWGPSSRHVCIYLSWRVSEGLISNGFETRLQELTQINAIMPIKWVDRSVLISRILKSTYDLQSSGSRILSGEDSNGCLLASRSKTTAMANRMDGSGNAHQRRVVPKSEFGIVLVHPQR